ncbi:hypothetical protein FE257_004289 [Aspergillus nanangensis]|uniref:Uncharacterized protein n=1 Tax=Aspergillus nanangensis TaxID=2582783 RepID=A0AAD4GXD0_ASPNN|nr:hypothetical protein FE257_004289 [Aspergillus nanangensis]
MASLSARHCPARVIIQCGHHQLDRRASSLYSIDQLVEGVGVLVNFICLLVGSFGLNHPTPNHGKPLQ